MATNTERVLIIFKSGAQITVEGPDGLLEKVYAGCTKGVYVCDYFYVDLGNVAYMEKLDCESWKDNAS